MSLPSVVFVPLIVPSLVVIRWVPIPIRILLLLILMLILMLRLLLIILRPIVVSELVLVSLRRHRRRTPMGDGRRAAVCSMWVAVVRIQLTLLLHLGAVHRPRCVDVVPSAVSLVIWIRDGRSS